MLYKVECADPGRITTFRKFEAQDRTEKPFKEGNVAPDRVIEFAGLRYNLCEISRREMSMMSTLAVLPDFASHLRCNDS